MKNAKIKIFPALALLIGVMCSGCSDFLDIKPKGKDIPETIEHYNGLFNNNDMMSLGVMMFYTDMTDESTATAESSASMNLISRRAYAWQADIFEEGTQAPEFNTLYGHVYTYNVIADGVMDAIDGTDQEKITILAEARATRAYYYMMLAQFFGKPYNESTAATDLCVPIVTKPNSTATDYDRNTVKEVWDFVIAELEASAPLLPEQTINRLRLGQAGGYMFLGKAYWLTGRYAEAAGAFAKAETALGKKSGLNIGLYDYNVMIDTWGYAMWEFAMGWSFAHMGSYPIPYNRTEEVFVKQLILPYTYANFAPPTLFVKPEFMALFGADDQRSKFYTTTNAQKTMTYPYNVRGGSRGVVNLGANLPDFYLMYAESLARTGDQTKARQLLTTLREKRMPAASAAIPASVATQNDLIRFVVEERKREFLLDGSRWFDMRRLWNDPLFQDMKAGYTHTDGTNTYTLTEDRLTYRIPPSVMKFNPGWTNNK